MPPRDPADLAVLAAMELIEARWPLATIAAALQRDEAWLQKEIDRTIADDAKAHAPALN